MYDMLHLSNTCSVELKYALPSCLVPFYFKIPVHVYTVLQVEPLDSGYVTLIYCYYSPTGDFHCRGL